MSGSRATPSLRCASRSVWQDWAQDSLYGLQDHRHRARAMCEPLITCPSRSATATLAARSVALLRAMVARCWVMVLFVSSRVACSPPAWAAWRSKVVRSSTSSSCCRRYCSSLRGVSSLLMLDARRIAHCDGVLMMCPHVPAPVGTFLLARRRAAGLCSSRLAGRQDAIAPQATHQRLIRA